MEKLSYMEDDYAPRKWTLIAGCYLFGGALSGIMFVALFVHGPYWLRNLCAIAATYGGGTLGALLYKRFHC